MHDMWCSPHDAAYVVQSMCCNQQSMSMPVLGAIAESPCVLYYLPCDFLSCGSRKRAGRASAIFVMTSQLVCDVFGLDCLSNRCVLACTFSVCACGHHYGFFGAHCSTDWPPPSF
ncbi:unnamed protein product [Prorocentrum cordatum]|uniref:Uncharacterized protein n=1 Tax=Prorocentrum cordatum TaxID=2364126 RepID=A0ABN9WAM3_9DINO|nr:unnamed protein product [Polarella glacialis]